MKRWAITWKDADLMPVAVLVVSVRSRSVALVAAVAADTAPFRDLLGVVGAFSVEELPPPLLTKATIERFAQALSKDPIGGFKEVTPPIPPAQGGQDDGQGSHPPADPR